MSNHKSPLDIFATELTDLGYYECTVWDMDTDGNKIIQTDENRNIFLLQVIPFRPYIKNISPELLTLSPQTPRSQNISCVFEMS